MAIDQLRKILPQPSSPAEAQGSWVDVESALKTKLPHDYMAFIENYGTGQVNNFLSVFNPFSKRANFNLLVQSKNQLEALAELQEQFTEFRTFDLFPKEGGLLPVAMTDNGDTIYWLTQGKTSEWSMVVRDARGPKFEQFKCGFTEFLVDILTGRLKSTVMPSVVFNGDAKFEAI
jgi:SMI1-KNR4 cell-wall